MGWCLVAWLPGGSQPGGRVRSALFLLPTGNAERGRRGSAGGPRGIAHQRPSSRKDVVYGHGGGGSTIGLNGLKGLFQSEGFYDIIICISMQFNVFVYQYLLSLHFWS